jgi:hypothetical protein
MRFVSTALVMMAILMLLALMLLSPTVRANPMIFVANLGGHDSLTVRKRQEPRTHCLFDIHHL